MEPRFRLARPPSGHWLAALMAWLLVMAACAPAAPAPTAAPAKPAEAAKPAEPAPAKPAELQTLQLGLVVNLNYLPVFVGIEKGLFLKHGLDLKVRLFGTGPETTKALQAGEVDIGAGNFATLISARAGGVDMKGFWLFQNDATVANNDDMLAVIVPPGSPIQKLSELASKKMGTTVGGAVDPYLRIHLQESGVDPKNVEFINATFANMPAALKAGGLDAALFQEPYAQMYLNDVPGGRVLVRGGGKVSFRILALGRTDWLAKNQPTAEKLSLGLAEASQYVRQHPDESVEVSTRWLAGLSPVVLQKSLQYFTFDPRLSKHVIASWDQEANTLLEQKRITQVVKLTDGFDTTFAEVIPRTYPQFFSDLKPLP